MIEYDPDRFATAAPHYARARRYPAALYDALARVFSLDGTGRLLDLATGTGQLAVPLAPYFEEVIALDPDVDMLGEAQGAALIAGARNIAFVRARAEDLPLGLGIFRLVTIGTALHWFDRPRVLETVYDMLEPGGAIAVVNPGFGGARYDGPDPRPVSGEVVGRYLGNAFAEAPMHREDWEPHGPVMARTRFGEPQRLAVTERAEQSADDLIELLLSTSIANRRKLGAGADAFVEELRAALLELQPSGIFVCESETEILYAHRL